jgi:hypothetical protein
VGRVKTRLGYLTPDGTEVRFSEAETRGIIERDPVARRAWLRWSKQHPGGTVWLLYRPRYPRS